MKNGWVSLVTGCTRIAAVTASLAIAACAASSSTPGPSPVSATAPAPAGNAYRDLTPPEKKAIMDSVGLSLRDPAAAKYHWTKLSMTPAEDGSYNYCATVDAQSPYAAYSGRQAYIVEVKLTLGKVTSAVMGLITGGKDFQLVSKMCAKYGLDPTGPS